MCIDGLSHHIYQPQTGDGCANDMTNAWSVGGRNQGRILAIAIAGMVISFSTNLIYIIMQVTKCRWQVKVSMNCRAHVCLCVARERHLSMPIMSYSYIKLLARYKFVFWRGFLICRVFLLWQSFSCAMIRRNKVCGGWGGMRGLCGSSAQRLVYHPPGNAEINKYYTNKLKFTISSLHK